MCGPKAKDLIGAERHDDGCVGALNAEVVHAIPGRVRLRIVGLKDGPELVCHVKSRLGSLERLRSFEVKPRSDSVVIYYEPTAQAAFTASLRTLFPNVNDLSSRSQHQAEQKKSDRRPDLAGEIADLFSQGNEGVEKAMGGIDLKLLVPIALLVFSLLGVVAGAVRQRKLPLPTWYDLLWFAFNTFVILNLTLSKRKDSKWNEEATDPKPESA